MNKIILLFHLTLLISTALTSCKKDVRSINPDINPVNNLAAPLDKFNIKLDPATGANIIFQWSVANTPDDGIILYEIVFDKASGSFSNPIYKVLASGGGLQTRAGISQKDLNKIAALAGIDASSSGEIKWAILATKATHTILSTQSHMLTLERPAGFAVSPDSMYITGTATEAGDDITKAIPLKRTAEGTFELYTSLKTGSYLLTDKPNANGTKYYVDENNIIREGSTPVAITGDAKAYRLNYDFNIGVATKTTINSIDLYMSAYNTSIGTLQYIGNSTWEVAGVPVEFFQFSWGRDERYKFIIRTPGGNEYWGSSNVNNNPPAGESASYFYLLPVTNAQWDNTYKFAPSADRANIKATIYFQAASPYRHIITVL